MSTVNDLILVLGGTGKTGRRIAQQLQTQGKSVRVASRGGDPAFDWQDQQTWPASLTGVKAAYISYYPDLAAPQAPGDIASFCKRAVEMGVEHLVLLSGRGEEEALRCEEIVKTSGADWTVLRCSWFSQNFSESFMYDFVMAGTITLPAGAVTEPFVDVEDIADIAVAALTSTAHHGQLYELTGPQLLSFTDLANELSRALGRSIAFSQIPHQSFLDALTAQNVDKDAIKLLDYLFGTVLDGRNELLTDGVQQALGRPARSFRDYARKTAATGVWDTDV